MSTMSSRPPRLEDARDFGQRALPAPARDAAPASASPRRAAHRRSAAPRARRAAGRRCRSRCSRFFAACSIAADASTAMTRATNGASAALTCPVPQPRSPTVQSLLGERRQRREMKAIAEQLVAHAIPLAGRRREELLRLASAARRAPPAAAADPAPRPATDPTCSRTSSPEPARGGVELVARHRVEVAGAFGARRDPAAVGQRLQMAADRRLRQLHDAAQLGDGQLVPVEQQQDAGCASCPPARRDDRGLPGARPFIRITG